MDKGGDNVQHNGKRIIVDYASMPISVYGVSQERQESYIILINSAQPPIVQRHATGHELAHIFLNHHSNNQTPTAELEREANKRAWEFYRLYIG